MRNSFQKGKVCIMPLRQEICRHAYHQHSLYILNMMNVAGRAQCILISQVSQVSKKQDNHNTSIFCLLNSQFTQKVFHILLLIATHADWFGFMCPGFKMCIRNTPHEATVCSVDCSVWSRHYFWKEMLWIYMLFLKLREPQTNWNPTPLYWIGDRSLKTFTNKTNNIIKLHD